MTDLLAQPIRGWRVWTLFPGSDQATITKAALPRIIEGSYDPFGPRLTGAAWKENWATPFTKAHCNHHPDNPGYHEHVPASGCTCGIWMVSNKKDVGIVARNYFPHPYPHALTPSYVGASPSAYAWGEVEGWGHAIEHDHGWRVQYARPISITIVQNGYLEFPEQVAEDLRRIYQCEVVVGNPPEIEAPTLSSPSTWGTVAPNPLTSLQLISGTGHTFGIAMGTGGAGGSGISAATTSTATATTASPYITFGPATVTYLPQTEEWPEQKILKWSCTNFYCAAVTSIVNLIGVHDHVGIASPLLAVTVLFLLNGMRLVKKARKVTRIRKT